MATDERITLNISIEGRPLEVAQILDYIAGERRCDITVKGQVDGGAIASTLENEAAEEARHPGLSGSGSIRAENTQLDGRSFPSEAEAAPGAIYVDDEDYLRIKRA